MQRRQRAPVQNWAFVKKSSDLGYGWRREQPLGPHRTIAGVGYLPCVKTTSAKLRRRKVDGRCCQTLRPAAKAYDAEMESAHRFSAMGATLIGLERTNPSEKCSS
jgi:hypothetical protein